MGQITEFLPPRGDILRLLALSFICFWHFGIQLYFMRSIWWHFLDPANLAIDLAAVGTLFGVCVIVPILLEIPFFHRFLLSHWWVFFGVVPACVIPFTAIPQTRARTVFLAISCACGYVGNAVAFSAPSGSPLSRAWPWAISLGVLMMQVTKIGWASVNPTMDKHYNDPEHAYIGLKLVACAITFVGAVYMRNGATEAATDASADEEAAMDPSKTCCPDRMSWLWVLMAPIVACATTVNFTFMSNPSAMAKHVGLDPFPACIVVPLCFAVSMPCSYFLARRGVALPIFATVTLFFGGLLLAGNAECRGPSSCDAGFSSFAGGVLLSLAQPALFMVMSIQVSRLARSAHLTHSCCGFRGAIGRLFACSGFLLFIHVYLYIATNTYGIAAFGGRIGAWLLLVTMPAVIGLLAIIGLHFKDRSLATVFTPTPEAAGLDAPASPPVVGPTPKAGLLLLVGLIVFMLVPAIAYRSARADVSNGPKPVIETAITVMAYNNMQGYDTDGYWNGECSVDFIRAGLPDHVAIPEGEAMRAYTGNRDAADFMATALEMHANYGPPGWTGGVGVATLSTRPHLESSWEPMPKEDARFNRFIVRDAYDVNGVKVTVLSIHAEWFGDPSVQVSFIAATAANITGPVIVTGDFNLEPNGANNNAKNSSGLQSMTDAGFESVTPLTCLNETHTGHLCHSPFPNVVVDADCRGLADCEGYQLDYIFYTPRWLQVVPGTVRVINGKIAETTWCSDHQPLVATLELTPEALATPALKAP